MERIEKYQLIIPYKTKVKLIYGNNNGKEGLVINKTYPRNGKYKTGNYHNYFQLTVQFEDNTKRATSCDYVEIIMEEIKMDYQKMWEELEKIIQRETKWRNIHDDFSNGICSTFKSILMTMEMIKSKYQPKQYTWSEILALEPLPKKIKSEFGDIYNYTRAIRNYAMFGPPTNISPSIEEMRNLWTIIE